MPSAIVSIGPELQHELLPPEVGMLLPCADTNLALLSAVDAAPGRFADLAIGLFLSDPFLNVDFAIRRLRAAGVGWIAGLPSACQHEPEFRQYLREVDLDLERELRILRAFSEAGFSTIATVSSAADFAAAAGVATATLIFPDIHCFMEGYPDLPTRRDLERFVTSQAREFALPLRIGLRRLKETDDAGDLDGLVLRPQRFQT